MARYVRETSGLVRQLRWWDVLVITVAAPTGSGVLFYAVQTSGQPGGSITLAFAIGMALFLPLVLASAALASVTPRSGGPYVAVSRFLHPAIAYLASCLLILGDGIVMGVLGFILMEIGGAMCSVVGQVYQVASLTSLGSTIGSNPAAPLGAVAWVLVFWGIMLRPPTVFRRILATLLFLPLVTTLLCILVFVMTPSSQAVVAFNEVWDPDSWQRVLDLARANGWDYEPFSWSSTFGMLLVVVWAFNGIEVASYAGGEVQAPERSYFRGLLLGWLGVGLLYMVTAASVIYSFGGISDAYHFLQANHSKELKEIMPAITPSVPFYMMCIVRSPVVAFMAAVAFVLWFAKIIPAVYLTCSRLMFALAMDRLLPQRFADVHPVTAVPTWATHTTALIGLVGAGFYYFKVGTVLGTLMFCTMFVAWPVGLALAVLPFRHPELIRVGWLRSPRILGLWPATWLGGITFVSGLILLYLAGREISSTAWIGIAIVVGLLLLNYFVRSSRLKAETSGQGAADLLPPDSVPATGGHRSL